MSSNNLSLAQVVRVNIATLGLGSNDTKWGDSENLDKMDISNLTKAHLKRHLIARGEDSNGNRVILLQRLEQSLQRERNMKIQRDTEAESKHRQIADLEEKGALYCIGLNHKGQLGLGDLDDRSTFTVIPETRGLGIIHVASRNDVVFAVSKNKNVYCWGGAGVGPMGVEMNNQKSQFMSPQLVQNLEEEDIVGVSIGSNHASAISEHGDVYVWGEGRNGCLGNGNSKSQATPDLVPFFVEKINIKCCSAGEMHNCALDKNGNVYSFGHSANGRLGLGCVNNPVKVYTPYSVQFPRCERVRLISCGTDHSLAVTACRIYSWGCGDGGKLGHGDYSDRWEPSEIVSLSGKRITDVSSGFWHSACIINIPPMTEGNGWLYTWGTGYNGQLGLNDVTTSTKPYLVNFFCDKHKLLRKVFCGSHHNAVLSNDNELFTWGSNLHKCLGHDIVEEDLSFTSTPGYCAGFGKIVNRIGRGFPQTIALGRGYTIVGTGVYSGPPESEAKRLMAHQINVTNAKNQLIQTQALTEKMKLAHDNKKKSENISFLTSTRLCILCEGNNKCTGFQVHSSKPSICKECGHSSVYHTIIKSD